LDNLASGDVDDPARRQLGEQWALQDVAPGGKGGFARRYLEIQRPLERLAPDDKRFPLGGLQLNFAWRRLCSARR